MLKKFSSHFNFPAGAFVKVKKLETEEYWDKYNTKLTKKTRNWISGAKEKFVATRSKPYRFSQVKKHEVLYQSE